MNPRFAIEQSSLGRVVVAQSLPEGIALFYTTSDFSGRLDAGNIDLITSFVETRFGLSVSLSSCRQVHGPQSAEAHNDSSTWLEHEGCDALWSERPGTALIIKAADCLPVTLYDHVAGVTANIHAGWRGSVAGIVSGVLEQLEKQTRFEKERASAFLGPSIRRCCFEVGEEVITSFEDAAGDLGECIDRSRGPRPFLDIPLFIASLLVRNGISADSVVDSGICTRCDGSIFHSYRRDGLNSGRNLAIVAQ